MTLINKLQFYALVVGLAVIFMGGVFTSGYIKGSGDATARCNAAALKDRIAELERDLQAQRIADAYGEFAWAMVNARNEELERERQEYADELGKDRPNDLCPYTSRDVERLRRLRGLKG